VVGSGTEAWEKLHEKGAIFDLVLTDVMMPAISGFNLLQMINEDTTLRQIPVICMSSPSVFRALFSIFTNQCTVMSGAAIDSKTANDSIKIGGQDYLTKPIGKELLKKKLDMVLQNVYQKRKEQEYRSVLAQERHKGSLLAKQMAAKEHEIDELKKKMNEMTQITREVLESPLQSITRSIENVINDAYWSQHEEEIRTQLQRILKELAGSSNLYRPSLENLMQNDRVTAVTKSFLVSELAEPASSPAVFPTPAIPSNVNGMRRNSVNTFPVSIKRTDGDHKTWEFDPFKYSESELWPIIVDMFSNFQLIELFRINIKKLQRFIMTVNSLYHKENRYHNFVHAFDVTHACYSFMTIMNAQQYLTHLDILALLVGSLCHDLDHPGFNNVFQVNAQTELAVYYNDISVLESHHASMTFRVLRNPDCNIFENLTEDQHKEVRRSMISLVLATDMSNHFEYVSKFQHHLSTHAFDRNKKEDRQMILNFLLKCADLSNVAKPRQLNDEWSNRVSDEFFTQVFHL
jgi:CheY-like chemotaxis protein